MGTAATAHGRGIRRGNDAQNRAGRAPKDAARHGVHRKIREIHLFCTIKVRLHQSKASR